MAAHMHLQHRLFGVPARASHGAGSDSRSVALQAAPRSCHAPWSVGVSGTLGSAGLSHDVLNPAHEPLSPGPCALAAPPARGARRPRSARAAPTAPRRARRADGAALTAPRARRRTTRACGTCTATPTGTCTWARRSIFGRPPSASRRRPPASPSAPPRARTTLPPGRPRLCSSCLARPATRRAGRRARRCAG